MALADLLPVDLIWVVTVSKAMDFYDLADADFSASFHERASCSNKDSFTVVRLHVRIDYIHECMTSGRDWSFRKNLTAT